MLWPLRPPYLEPAPPGQPSLFARLAGAAASDMPTARQSSGATAAVRAAAIGSAIAPRPGRLRTSFSAARTTAFSRSLRAVGLWGSLWLAACAAPIAVAPFPARPDTVIPGSLLGPFDGQVVDQGTGNPIAGALVLASWAFETAAGLPTPEAAYTDSTLTGNDGNYRLPALPRSRLQSALLRRFSLIVYKAGYIGYRSDLRSDDHSPRHDFAQRTNRIRLERFAQGESHARHLVFLGASPELRRVAQAEIVQAALELGEAAAARKNLVAPEDLPPPAPPAEPAELTLSMRLLTRGDVEELAGQSGTGRAYALAPLPPPTSELLTGSESVHYKANDNPETWDAALRIWRTGSGAAAKALFARLRAQIATPPLRDGRGAAPTVPAPAARATTPLLGEVPAAAPVLRDASGGEEPAPAPSPTPPAAAAKAGPIVVDDSLQVYDAKLRIYGVVVLSQRLGAVLQLTCGADLCKSEEGAARLMTRILGRL